MELEMSKNEFLMEDGHGLIDNEAVRIKAGEALNAIDGLWKMVSLRLIALSRTYDLNITKGQAAEIDMGIRELIEDILQDERERLQEIAE